MLINSLQSLQLIMKKQLKEIDELSNADSMTSNSSFIINDKELQRAKKKKKAAFQSFLSRPQPDPQQNTQKRRKMSDHEIDQQSSAAEKYCNICNKILSDKVKVCEFCKQTMCIGHFRKARRNPTTNKFSRICDLCEDKYLMERHYRSQMKNEETLVSQEEVVTIKYDKIRVQLQAKRQKLAQIRQKTLQIIYDKKDKMQSILQAEKNLEKQSAQIEKGALQNKQLQKRLYILEHTKPPSLESDYNALKGQKQRINKDYNKIKRQFEHAQKHKIQLQKKMYEDFYEWQLIQKYKIRTLQKKKEDQCDIY